MTQQTSLWQEPQSSEFSELCNALYERELKSLAELPISSLSAIQGRLKSLPHYIKRTASLMIQAQTPLIIDIQNASWSAKQGANLPLSGQDLNAVNKWYLSIKITHGLVVPIHCDTHIELDCVDRVDVEHHRFRTNTHGWFKLNVNSSINNRVGTEHEFQLLKPNKKVMTAACTGHRWVNHYKANPLIPSLRELLLSCAINWRNFKQPNTY
ncbi:MAG: hypothetical protein ACI9LM_002443 [Alteromonadaceae bacterium]|jgi:hypothetical protein